MAAARAGAGRGAGRPGPAARAGGGHRPPVSPLLLREHSARLRGPPGDLGPRPGRSRWPRRAALPPGCVRDECLGRGPGRGGAGAPARSPAAPPRPRTRSRLSAGSALCLLLRPAHGSAVVPVRRPHVRPRAAARPGRHPRGRTCGARSDRPGSPALADASGLARYFRSATCQDSITCRVAPRLGFHCALTRLPAAPF